MAKPMPEENAGKNQRWKGNDRSAADDRIH
jgi:hypothetical protein